MNPQVMELNGATGEVIVRDASDDEIEYMQSVSDENIQSSFSGLEPLPESLS